MKRFTLAIAACVMALSAMAHRDVYFTWGFANAADLGHKSFTTLGCEYVDGTTMPLLVALGDYTHNQKPSIAIKHDSRSHGQSYMPRMQKVVLELIAGAGDNLPPHVTPCVEVRDDDGHKATFTFEPIVDDVELDQRIESTGIKGDDIAEFGNITDFTIYFDGVEEGETVAPQTVTLCSDWIMPTVNPNREITNIEYQNAAIEREYTEKGVTYIQAEDFNEPWILAKEDGTFVLGHSSIQGNNGSRLYAQDRTVGLQHPDDGHRSAKWNDNFGHILANHLSPGGYGPMTHDFIPRVEWTSYYGQYADDENLVTLNNAIKCWSAWLDFSFDVEQDCYANISIRSAAHRGVHDGTVSGSPKYGADRDERGYVVEGLDDDYHKIYGFKYICYLDGNQMPVAYDKFPKWTGDGDAFMEVAKDPSKWESTQVMVDGKLQNNVLLHMFPNPYTAVGGVVGQGWLSYYKEELLKIANEEGVCSDADYEKYSKGDYVGLHLTPGRHTLRVQNMSGCTWFDEIRIEAYNDPAGIDQVSAEAVAADVPARYFDLQGREVANPQGGIYIVKRGNEVSKQVVR